MDRNPEPSRLWDALPKECRHYALVPTTGGDRQLVMKEVPTNRPCDWCGKVVDVGYLYEECREDDMKFWLEVIHG